MNDSPEKQKSFVARFLESGGGNRAANLVGLAWMGNTAISLVINSAVRKFFPNQIENIRESLAERSVTRQLDKIGHEVAAGKREPVEDLRQLHDELKKQALVKADNTLDWVLMSTGGYAVIPLQAALDNVRKSPDGLEGTVHQLREEKHRFFMSDSMKQNGMRWAFGRVTAQAAAFGVFQIVETHFSDQKEKLDHAISKVLTRAAGKSRHDDPEYVDKGIYDNVKRTTLDAYLTLTAFGTQSLTVDAWEHISKRLAAGRAH